jgi:hypothetical protein
LAWYVYIACLGVLQRLAHVFSQGQLAGRAEVEDDPMAGFVNGKVSRGIMAYFHISSDS